ncbi:hypothetical protein BH20VER2_BH20VER2_05980 [soil metagenome]
MGECLLTAKKPAMEVCTLVKNSNASSQQQQRWWGWAAVLLAFCSLGVTSAPGAIELSKAEAARIGRKIWQNESGGTIAGLTSWNTGENFASLGIGHFIWYPRGVRGPFDESFPELARFAASRNARLPQVVTANLESGCPWATRAEFLAASDSPEMKQLRKFLADTVDVQADFLVRRLQKALPKMLGAAPAGERANIQRQFDRVASTATGCYALVDYVNFKGEGVLDTERYRGQGWGLMQVLQGMSGAGGGAAGAREFAASARRVLTQRVENSPPERKESRWLPGWLKRVNTYTQA